jgi:competence protein ComEC
MKKVSFIVIVAFLALIFLFMHHYVTFHDGKLHVVFCDVGQGDGILITTPSNKQILVDAGPDKRILDCLSQHMPFWDRTIDIALLTHPHADHFAGYYYVIDRYRLEYFATEALRNNTDGFEELEKRLKIHNLPVRFVYSQDKWLTGDGVEIEIAGPEKAFLVAKDPDGIITSSAESASLAIKVSYGDFSVLLTGDAPLDQMQMIAEEGAAGLDVLQIPHHGSSTGVDKHIIESLSPALSIISVGKNNYGHPKKEVLDVLQELGIKVLRTDKTGDVELVSDGEEWIAL